MKKIDPATWPFSDPKTRRELVQQALALGVGLGSLGTLLSACGGGGGETPPTPKPTEEPAEPGLEGELRIYNWSDYVAEDTIPNFEKEFGVKVVYDTYESNEELIAKLQVGGGGYDLVCPSGNAIQVLLALDLLDKLDKKLILNLVNVADPFKNPTYDPGQQYAVPWQWGMTGVAYRTDKVATPPDSWAVFHDAKLAGKMTMMDDMRDVIGAWLRFRGHSQNSVDPAELEQAKVDAIQAKKNLQSFVSAPVKAQLIAGDVWVAQLWDGDTAQARAELAEIAWVLPKEGANIWTDSMVIPKAAKHKRAAHAFLDYVLRPEVGAAISNYTGYGCPNAAALAKMENPTPFPTPEQMAILEFQRDLGEASTLWDQIWTEIKAG